MNRFRSIGGPGGCGGLTSLFSSSSIGIIASPLTSFSKFQPGPHYECNHVQSCRESNSVPNHELGKDDNVVRSLFDLLHRSRQSIGAIRKFLHGSFLSLWVLRHSEVAFYLVSERKFLVGRLLGDQSRNNDYLWRHYLLWCLRWGLSAQVSSNSNLWQVSFLLKFRVYVPA